VKPEKEHVMINRSPLALSRLLVGGLAVVALLALALVGASPSASAAPAARMGGAVFALTDDGRLISFDAARPRRLTSDVAISGLKPGESLVGIDFRPATKVLYGVGSSSRLYTIDLTTGVATAGPALSTSLSGSQFGVDFNPVPDRLRIVSDSGQNLRVNVDTGAVIVDGSLAYAAGDPNAGARPMVVGAAYTNPDTDPNTGTQLFDIDASGVLALQNPPNDGTLITQVEGMANVTGEVAFDIGAGSRGIAAIQRNGDAFSRLYQVDTVARTASSGGVVGGGEVIRGLAIQLP
jgi:hypothetical protein